MACEICGRGSCARYMHSLKAQEQFDNQPIEDARRLDRYDEAVRLIERLCANGQDLFEWHKALEDGQDFLAAEPKVGEGGR